MRLDLRHLIALVLVLLAAAAVWWIWFRPETDEARIRRLFGELAESLCRDPSESTPTGLLKSRSVAETFTDPVEVTLDEYATGKLTQEQVLSHAMQYRAFLETANVSVSDLRITVTAPDRALCTFAGRFVGRSKSGASHREVRDLSAELVKVNNEWKIKSIQFEKVLH